MMAAAPAGGYQVSRSLRFNSSDSAFCSRTPAVAGNRRTWTWAGWVKRSALSAYQRLFSNANSGNSQGFYFDITPSNFDIYDFSSNYVWEITTSQVFRDVSAWYHILLAFDTTQATAANRVKLYINGAQVTTFSTATYPSQNYEGYWNSLVSGNELHVIGRTGSNAGASYFDGYLADIHFIDGQQLTPSSFTEVSATTGQLIPLAYSGTFGTNGFWLKFSDNSAATAAALGNDYSGNNNDWTPNNLSVTAGAGNDSLVDTPTSISATDTGVGGEVRGNYATLNPLASAGTFSNGNLEVSVGSLAETSGLATFGLPASGKWYWEVGITAVGSDSFVGIANGTSRTGLGSSYYYYRSIGGIFAGVPAPTSTPSPGATYTTGDIIGIAYNADAATLAFYKNNAIQGTFTGVPAGVYFPFAYCYDNATKTLNFGQRAFAYTAPSGFKALCDTNLGAPVVAKPNELFDALIWSGDSVNNRKLTTNFGPDLFWAKQRNGVAFHSLNDSVRGPNAILQSNTTSAEQVNSNGYVITFASDGVNVTNGSDINASGSTYVAWAWDAGTTTASNGSGSITSQVRANVSAGFSVVTYTGNGTDGATVGHGLGLTPGMIIVKIRESSNGYDHGWIVAHSGLTNYNSLWLNETGAANAGPGRGWINPYGSSTFTLKAGNGGTSLFDNVNQNGKTYVAYCFAPVAGFSSFGSYVGNGSSDGPFVFTGMRPRWVMVKSTTITSNWMILDTARDTYNVASKELGANRAEEENNAEQFAGNTDINSNGFKLRSSNTEVNQSAATYIYAAFAENPFQYARAR